MDKKRSRVESQDNSKISKADTTDFFVIEDPYDMSERFKNL